MCKWLDSWGVWVIVTVSLIVFGILIGHDLTRFSSIHDTISSIGTFMLGGAALFAIPYWKKQERMKFQAACAAELHSSLYEAQRGLNYEIMVYKQGVENLIRRDAQSQIGYDRTDIEHFKEKVTAQFNEIIHVLDKSVKPRALILGVEFSESSQKLIDDIGTLVTESNWDNLPQDYLDDLVKLINELLDDLVTVSLLQR